MRLKPLDTHGQHCLSFTLHTEPLDEVLQYKDRFGNDVRHFDVIQPHQRLVVSARSEVLTTALFNHDEDQLSPVDEYDYLMATEYAPITAAIREIAYECCTPELPLETAQRIMRTVHGLIVYEKGATDVTTSAAKALELGRGVCQDFSHLMLAACRSQQIPARYVSGYLYNNGLSSATHAWVDVHIPGQGWISLDPTHNLEQNEAYVRIAVGRDYGDVPPTQGVFVGNGKEQMDVDVTVKTA